MPPSKDPKKRAKQIAALRKGAGPDLDPAIAIPVITPAAAESYVKLVTAGVPEMLTLRMLYPVYMKALGSAKRNAEVGKWQKHHCVAKALADVQGGNWQDLDADARLKLAYDKHCSQCAYYLYSTDYATADADSLRRIQDARSTLVARLRDDTDGEGTSPFNQLVARLLQGQVTKELEQPVYAEPEFESAPIELVLPPHKRGS